MTSQTVDPENGSPNSSLSLIPGGDETGKYNGSGIELNPVNQKLKKLLQEAKDGKPADEAFMEYLEFKQSYSQSSQECQPTQLNGSTCPDPVQCSESFFDDQLAETSQQVLWAEKKNNSFLMDLDVNQLPEIPDLLNLTGYDDFGAPLGKTPQEHDLPSTSKMIMDNVLDRSGSQDCNPTPSFEPCAKKSKAWTEPKTPVPVQRQKKKKKMSYSSETIDKAVACVRNGQSIGSCVKEFGIPDSSLRKICHDRNVSYPRQNRGIPKEKKLIMAKQAAEKVMGGQSINKTAREFGVDPKTMRTWLEKLNIRSRERTKAKSYNEDDVQKALEELKRSCSLVSLSRKYNVPCSVLKRRRDKLLQDPAKEKGQKQANPASPIIINSTKDEWVNHAFKLGTVVWAKLVGFPWWPGIIAIDPDVQNFYRNLEFSTRTPVWYHIVFFAKKGVTCSWVRTADIKSFDFWTTDEISVPKQVDGLWNEAIKQAQLTLDDALE